MTALGNLAKGWNFGAVWSAVAEHQPDVIALSHGTTNLSWRDFDRRANSLANAFIDTSFGPAVKVAVLTRNHPAYLETLFATFKSGMVAVNSNYRYQADELEWLWRSADVEIVVFSAEFTDTCAKLRQRMPHVRRWIVVGDPPDGVAPWADDYESIASVARPALGRYSGHDLFLLFTGGTTGHPKGVMWRHDDLFRMLEAANGRTTSVSADPIAYAASISRRGPAIVPAAPLMHGTALWFAMPVLNRGGAVVTLTQPRFEPDELLSTIEREDVRGICIVGDPFAVPILETLAMSPNRWDLSQVRVIFSSGAMFSADRKAHLLEHMPNATVIDSLGSSESGSLARSIASAGHDQETAQFSLNATTRVIADDGRDVPRDGQTAGRIAVGGFIPLGYYNDAEKTEATFLTFGGTRYVVAGDWATVRPDGTITLLGRGSGCINTGGEKVYPEEVEEALKLHPEVVDALVVGLPHPRLGEAVTAVVQRTSDAATDSEGLITHVKAHVASYKAPRAIFELDTIPRGPNGKPDYAAAKATIESVAASNASFDTPANPSGEA